MLTDRPLFTSAGGLTLDVHSLPSIIWLSAWSCCPGWQVSPWEKDSKLGVPLSVHHLSPGSPGAWELSSLAPRKDTGLCSTTDLEGCHLRVPLSLQLDLLLC